MKLIIDIPNEVYETRKFVNYFGVVSTKLLETIDTGIPCEEQKQGEWIEDEFGNITCNKCNEIALFSNDDTEDYMLSNYCPNCGAKMKQG